MGGSISALKPGPVVPPGTQKTPDQAARNSQSVDFAHLSDILGFLRGGQFLTLFSHFFVDFNFITFLTFVFFHFVDFFTFCIFLIFSILAFSDFDTFFTLFCVRDEF